MKKIYFTLFVLVSSLAFSQFTINLNVTEDFTPKEVYTYKLSGSKDILITKENRKGNTFTIKVPENYTGMLKFYFPQNNVATSFISENKDVSMRFVTNQGKVTDIIYLDDSNKTMEEVQGIQRRREDILPALYQIKDYYKPTSDFAKALDKEILALSSGHNADLAKYPFVDYYVKNYDRFLITSSTNPKITGDDIITFFSNSNSMLESSSLMRPLLMDYLQKYSSGNTELHVDKLLTAVNLESPRGQTVLSELIDIFGAMGMSSLKDKYLTQAKNLKCTINDRLANTIKVNNNTEVGAQFANYVFTSPKNTSAKSIHDVKADKKVIVFWSSTCSHCETELPQMIPFYSQLKAKNIEIIGLSLDSDKNSYENKAKNYPWISDSELKGWYSSSSELYNVHATPSYFILDSQNKIIDKPDHVADVLQFLGLK